MSLGLESGPPEPPSVKGRKRLSPWTLDLPQPFLSPRRPPVRSPTDATESTAGGRAACQNFVLYIYSSGRQNGLPTAPTGQLGVGLLSVCLSI